MLCVSLFIFTGFVHSIDAQQTSGGVSSTELAVNDLGDRSDTPENPTLHDAHCHSCASAMISVVAHGSPIAIVLTKPDMDLADKLLASDRQYDTPPPKV
jgi:hypothetical protein